MWVFQGQNFAFRAAINISYREITAKRVASTSFLCLISLKSFYISQWLFLVHVFAEIFI